MVGKLIQYILKSWPLMVILLALVLAAGGCRAIRSVQLTSFRASDEARDLLEQIDGRLSDADAELSIRCWPTSHYVIGGCAISLDKSRTPAVEAELIDHPFSDMIANAKPIMYRIYGGSETLQDATYAALGELGNTVTKEITTSAGIVLQERSLDVDYKNIRIRCTATLTSPSKHECRWMIDADILN